jgi:protein-S-isoprenylcysteine O-methyltransferase Ste14
MVKGEAMRRSFYLLYGIAAYVLFLGVFLYAVGFVGNVFVPRSIDAVPSLPLGWAALVNALLLGIFAIQHSVMARPTFKRWWTRFVPEPIERSTYVLFSNAAMILLFLGWCPMGGVIWDVQHPAARSFLLTLFAIGWAIVLVTTFMINHFDLFGLRQVWLAYRNIPYTPPRFDEPGFYAHVRHPLYVGWMIAFWATPTMTAAHLLFAVLTTAYILVAIWFEERNLVDLYGRDYVEYRRRVPMFVPRFIRRRRSDAVVSPPAPASIV